MKSVLLFAFMSILANFMWCSKNDDPPIPGPPNGTYHILERQTFLYGSNDQLLGETKETFEKGEKTFALNIETGDYKEFENGNLTKAGNYLVNNGSFYIITGNDTLKNNIVGIGESSLWFNTIELLPNGKKSLVIKSEK